MGITKSKENDDKHLIRKKGYSAEYGVRAIKRAINKYIVDGLASALSQENVFKYQPIIVGAHNKRIILRNSISKDLQTGQ